MYSVLFLGTDFYWKLESSHRHWAFHNLGISMDIFESHVRIMESLLIPLLDFLGHTPKLSPETIHDLDHLWLLVDALEHMTWAKVITSSNGWSIGSISKTPDKSTDVVNCWETWKNNTQKNQQNIFSTYFMLVFLSICINMHIVFYSSSLSILSSSDLTDWATVVLDDFWLQRWGKHCNGGHPQHSQKGDSDHWKCAMWESKPSIIQRNFDI